MRKGELLALRVRDVGLKEELLGSRVPDVNLLDDLLDGWLTVVDSKNGESRKIPLTQETKTLLGECIRGKERADFILTRQDGSRVAQPRKDWYSLCCRCGLGKNITEKNADGKTPSVRYEGLQMHDLRRSAVRRMIRSGISQTVAMRISGHKTASVFRRYDITDECDLEQAAKLLEPSRQSVSEVETVTKPSRRVLPFRKCLICRGSSVVERRPEKAGVASSILAPGTSFGFSSSHLSLSPKQIKLASTTKFSFSFKNLLKSRIN